MATSTSNVRAAHTVTAKEARGINIGAVLSACSLVTASVFFLGHRESGQSACDIYSGGRNPDTILTPQPLVSYLAAVAVWVGPCRARNLISTQQQRRDNSKGGPSPAVADHNRSRSTSRTKGAHFAATCEGQRQDLF
ncbi:hypothetical protein QBC34DRAFT_85919 [Podospora aff. communis PSN243]|uniref:Uncharacterized protein n=1 Tax=Podospora aff. communis PSN243 TaxID=3040156 RepID=A0AAV9GTK5_9PEZI|nr:hypothetical protein QBC34DRAFT_85919 [Podospora aff. communis PSN243]